MSVREIPLELVDVVANVRETTDPGLVDSVRQHGVLQAITVRRQGKRYQVVMGHRRVAAARLVGLETIPALIEDVAHDDQILRQVAENVHRRGMNPMDVARALEAYLKAHPGMDKAAVGAAMGFRGQYAGVWVSNKLGLLQLDEATQDRIERRELAEHLAIKQRPKLNDGRGRRSVIPLPDEDGRSRSVEVEAGRSPAGRPGRFSIGVDHMERTADLVVEVGELRLFLTLAPADAKLLGRRLTQAYEAIA